MSGLPTVVVRCAKLAAFVILEQLFLRKYTLRFVSTKRIEALHQITIVMEDELKKLSKLPGM